MPTLGTVAGRNQPRQSEAADHLQDQFDVAVRRGRLDGEGLIRMHQGFVPEHLSEPLDFLRRPVGEVVEGAFADAAVFAEGFSQQDGRRRVAVRYDVDIHGYIL